MGDNIRVHGTVRRSKRLELAVAKIIAEVRKHEEVQNQKVQSSLVG